MEAQEFIQQIDSMTVLELNDLVKALEDHYGVSAAAAEVEETDGVGVGGADGGEKMNEFYEVLGDSGDLLIEAKQDVGADPAAGV
jgi:large subunit ribosomal protein L7/L12